MKTLADKFRNWYSNGERGLITLCEKEDVPEVVKEYARHWFKEGRKNFDVYVAEVEKLSPSGE